MNQRISAVNNVLGFDIVALASNLCSTSYVYFIRLNGVGHGGSRQLFLSTFPHAARLHQQDKLSDYHCYVNTFVENKHVATFYVLGWTLVANFGSRPSVHVGTHFWTNSAKVSRTMSTSSPFGRRKKSGSQTEVKIAVTGVSGVGKSAVTVRFLTKRFIGEYGHEPETKYHHQCKIDGDIVLMEILDTGHENVLTEDVLQWADGLLLVYSITDLRSIEAIRRARNTLEESRNSKAVPVAFTVVANKADLLHLRKVDTTEGERLSKDMGCSFVELSASESYDKIADVFHELYREIKMYKFGTRSTLFGRMFGHTRDKKTMTL